MSSDSNLQSGSESSDSPTRFSPRPDARDLAWCQLLAPVREAVYELLVRIDGAVAAASQGELAHAFLVTGERGTGKTTVLLSAQRAVKQALGLPHDPSAGDYWRDASAQDTDDRKRKAARQCAGSLGDAQVAWLDILDLQALAPDANLLTSLLIRVRSALGKTDHDRREDYARSLLEEGAKGARSLLGRLIDDATLMWESVQERDTRGRANQQIEAADIYAGFQDRFRKAMAALSKELWHTRGGRLRECCPIILPIDNIDRSTEHLSNIVKLAQMVSCPELWLILAGERLDVETFLERAYWKELIRVDGGAIAMSKEDPGGEDEALVMARRQAAAALHKLLPPSHRIEVELVPPQDTLAFYPSDGGPKPTIRALLSRVPVPSGPSERAGNQQQGEQPTDGGKDQKDAEDSGAASRDYFRLIDLFEPQYLRNARWKDGTRVINADEPANGRESESKEGSRRFSFAARDALRLPARSVLDLWQVAHWASNPIESEIGGPSIGARPKQNGLAAERIARTMLRNVIAASTLSNKVGRYLQNEVIRRDQDGGTILDFSGTDLKISPLIAFGIMREFPTQRVPPSEETNGVGQYLRSSLQAHSIQSVVMSFGSRGSVLSEEVQQGNAEQASRRHRSPDTGIPREKLPPLVAGWLAILFDILMLTERVAIINIPKGLDALSDDSLTTSHELVIRDRERLWDLREIEFSWPAPSWDTFLAHDLFTGFWEEQRKDFQDLAFGRGIWAKPTRFCGLAAVWVYCALRTFAVLDDRLDLQAYRQAWADLKKGSNEEDEQRVMTEIGSLYQHLIDPCVVNAEPEGCAARDGKQDLPQRPEGFAARERERVLRQWLENKLPRLLGQAYLPLGSPAAVEAHFERVCGYLHAGAARVSHDRLQRSALVEYWFRNAAMILAPIERKVCGLPAQRDIYPPTPAATASAGSGPNTGGTGQLPPPLPAPLRVLSRCLGLDPKPETS